MTRSLFFEVGGQGFRVVGEAPLVDFARTEILRDAVVDDVGRGATVLRLVSSMESTGQPIVGLDGTTVGSWEPADDGIRVACLEGLAVVRGVALAMAKVFRPPRFLIVHGAGLAHQGKAVLALGPSGAGKSTLSTLVTEADLLSDEVLVVEVTPDGAHLHGTPIRSSSPRPLTRGSGRLVGLLTLVKSPDVALHPFGAAAAVRLVLEQTFVDNSCEPEHYLDAAAGLVEKVPAQALHFRKDDSCSPLVMRLLA